MREGLPPEVDRSTRVVVNLLRMKSPPPKPVIRENPLSPVVASPLSARSPSPFARSAPTPSLTDRLSSPPPAKKSLKGIVRQLLGTSQSAPALPRVPAPIDSPTRKKQASPFIRVRSPDLTSPKAMATKRSLQQARKLSGRKPPSTKTAWRAGAPEPLERDTRVHPRLGTVTVNAPTLVKPKATKTPPTTPATAAAFRRPPTGPSALRMRPLEPARFILNEADVEILKDIQALLRGQKLNVHNIDVRLQIKQIACLRSEGEADYLAAIGDIRAMIPHTPPTGPGMVAKAKSALKTVAKAIGTYTKALVIDSEGAVRKKAIAVGVGTLALAVL